MINKQLEKEALNQLMAFVDQHIKENVAQLALKKELLTGFDNRFVLHQIAGKQKAKHKLPFLFEQPNILYPPKISVEQSTSQQVATWKSQLVAGENLLDMTGGFGVDSFFFSKKIKKVSYIEQQTALFEVVQHNYKVLQANNIDTYNKNAVDFLKDSQEQFDWIYLDPARRDSVGRRKIGLADYTPNVLELKELLFQKGKRVLLKTSPMLDIQQAVQQLGTVEKIWVVAVQNEVKELLFLLTPLLTTPSIECINLGKQDTIVSYTPNYPLKEEVDYTLPKTYLYEPNASILKGGLFKEIAIDFELSKLHPNTHLYTSDRLVSHFPGRIFTCIATVPFQKDVIRPYLVNEKANITTRNFPYTVAQIKKRLRAKDGGALYLFGATLLDGSLRILICRKVSEK